MSTFIESANKNYEAFDNTNEQKTSTNYKIFNKKLLFLAFVMLILMGLPFLVYLEIFDEGDYSKHIENRCLIDKIYRVPCGKNNITSKDCINLQCCFETFTNSCYHSEPSKYYYYKDKSGIFIPSQEYTPLGLPSLKKLKFSITEQSEKLTIVLNATQFLRKIHKENFSYFDIIEDENNKLSITVFRKNTKEMLLTTSKGPMIASEKYLEWTLQLTNASGILFGLGELKIDLNENSTLSKIIYKNQNDHNTLPIFMAYNNGKYHAASIIHEGALQITVLPSYLIILRSISGRKIEIQVHIGPSPVDIFNQLRTNWNDPSIPEWAFGVHLCREETVDNLKTIKKIFEDFVYRRTKYPKFNYESDCIHDDLLLHILAENYTSQNLEELFQTWDLKEKFILSYPPQVPVYSMIFQKYKDGNIFYKNETTGNYYVGKYRGLDVVFPDYRQKNINDFLNYIMALFKNIKVSGITFTHDWPQDDSYQVAGSKEPYINETIQEALSNTLPWNLREENDLHLRYHNEYGRRVQKIVKTISKLNLSFSAVSELNTFEPIIIQNLNTSWTDLGNSLRRTLSNSLFGHTLLAIPICGTNEFYNEELNEDLCLRWYLLAATMPLIRISSRGKSRDPTNLYTKYTNNKVIEILEKRKSFVPYYRTIHNEGGPIIRPMFYNFPTDKNVFNLDGQYMIGDAILVAQPLLPDLEQIKIYLPPNIVWYELWGGSKYITKKGAEWIKFPIFKSDWISFIKEGTIVAKVSDGAISLIVAMNCTEICKANGNLLLNIPDEQIDVPVSFTALNENITIHTTDNKHDYATSRIKNIQIYGYNISKDGKIN